MFLLAAIDRNDNVQTADGGPLVIYDTLATANGQNLYAIDPNGDGDWRIPAGTCLYIYQFDDDGQWEPVGNFGACCRQGSGSGTSETSETSETSRDFRRVLSAHDLRIRRIGQPRHLRSERHLHNKRLRDVELHESIFRFDVHACRLCRRHGRLRRKRVGSEPRWQSRSWLVHPGHGRRHHGLLSRLWRAARAEGTQVAIELGACLPPAGGSYACIQDPLPCRPQASGNYVLAIDGPDNPPYWKLQS